MPTTVWTVWAGWTQWLSDWRDVILDRTLDQLLGALVVAFVLSVLMAWVVVRMGRARREALAPVAATLMLGHLLAISVGGVQVHRDLRDLTNFIVRRSTTSPSVTSTNTRCGRDTDMDILAAPIKTPSVATPAGHSHGVKVPPMRRPLLLPLNPSFISSRAIPHPLELVPRSRLVLGTVSYWRSTPIG